MTPRPARRPAAILLLLAVQALAPPRAPAAEPSKPGYLVLAPKAALPTLAPLLDLRRKSHAVAVLTVEELRAASPRLTPQAIKTAVRARHTAARPLACLLLVGDTRPGADGLAAVPTHPRGFDVWYGTLTTDNPRDPRPALHRPAIAVGRFPATSRAGLAVMVRKTVDYETRSRPGPWQRRLHAIAGTGNYSPAMDRLIDRAGAAVLGTVVPAHYDVTMTRGQTSSPYGYPPAEFQQRVVELFNEGALFVAYVGHGNADSSMRTTGFARETMMDCGTMRRLACDPTRRPIALFVACNMGEFDWARGPCMAEAALRCPGGPVAVLSSIRRSDPYGNGVLGLELARVLLGGRAPTLGGRLLAAVARITRPPSPFDVLRALMNAFGPKTEAARRRELIEHVYLYNVLGDPALRVAYPSRRFRSLRATVEGAAVKVEGIADGMASGRALVTLETARTTLLGKPEPVRPDQPGWAAAMKRNYAAANRKVLAESRVVLTDGRFRAALPARSGGQPLPAGTYVVKAFAWNGRGAASAASTVAWTPPK